MGSMRFAVLLAGLLLAPALALGQGNRPPGVGPPTGGESASNISFPIIMSDNIAPALPADGDWKFVTITDPTTQCVGEGGVDGAVDPTIPCYYGRHVTVVSETGETTFDGDPKVWWLQKRGGNFWKAFTVGYPGDPATAGDEFVVSFVDIGDLLESTPDIATRQIRSEVNLLQQVSVDDPDLGQYVADWTTYPPSACTVPTPNDSMIDAVNCFAAVGMSGAVPGTEMSGDEAQGTDFGPGTGTCTEGTVTDTSICAGTTTLLNPADIRNATVGGVDQDVHAIVYSRCARLVIQKVGADLVYWDETKGQWAGNGVGAPVVNVSAYGGTYSTEINSGGGLVYGYNWNAKTLPTGTYRFTFVLDGNDDEGPKCGVLNTVFASGVTSVANAGEVRQPTLVFAGDSDLGDEGGLVYLDVPLSTKGGGGGGAKGPPTR